ncbi:hypothetical protein [Streptomyces sp. NPDC060031]|uniref:hypothetical protein n=1 Tax=Streptomyces sp. NPDC060031 TaxID=3347043 RepID=UPI0036A044C5
MSRNRAAGAVDVAPGGMRNPVPWVVALHEDPEAMRRLAGSAHLLVRSSVATARRLARDEDRVVRLFLAEKCDDAPAEMLLEVWQWWNGSFSAPDRPYGQPNFPRRDLLRFAEAPHPRLRQPALDDPDSTAGLVERFSRDGQEKVRQRAATDPRLSAEPVLRLLADPQAGVRDAAGRHPRLPAPRIGPRPRLAASAHRPAAPRRAGGARPPGSRRRGDRPSAYSAGSGW